MLADQCDYPLHLGLTEAGMGTKGIVATTAGITPLLIDGIGDTIRVSLTPEAGRRPHGGGPGSAADPPVPETPQFRAPGHGLPGVRSYDQQPLSGDGSGYRDLYP